MSKIPIYCILAVDENNGIATVDDSNNGSPYIPWNFKEDMEYFKRITTSVINCDKRNAVIMGRITYEDIPEKNRPLVGRLNIIISSKNLEYDGTLCFKSPEEAIEYVNTRTDIERIFVIGGVSLYNQYINSPTTSGLYLTKINHNYNTSLSININIDNYTKIRDDIVTGVDLKSNITVKSSFGRFVNKNIILSDEELSHIKNDADNVEEMQYLNILKNILKNGHYRSTRNANTYSLFGGHMEFNLENGKFPLLTTKKMFTKGIFEELKFFLMGLTNSKILEEKGVNIWKGNTTREFLDSVGLNHFEEGDMGPLYPHQMRHFGAEYTGCKVDYTGKGVDQVSNMLDTLKNDKYSRRILMTTYNPSQVKQAPLPPCHGIAVQFGIEGTNKLCCHMYQR